MRSDDLMDPRVAQVMDVLKECSDTVYAEDRNSYLTVVVSDDFDAVAARIVDALDKQAERLQGAER